MYHGEKFNSISHLAGAALALVGLGALLSVSIPTHDPWVILSFTIFGISLVTLYTSSTLYHSFQPPNLKGIFQKLDHAAIYLLIAGTYAPYMMVSLRDGRGAVLLTVVCSLAVVGLLLDMLVPSRPKVLQILIYLVMGWTCVLEYSSLMAAIPFEGFIWLNLGGLAYSVGVGFYVLDELGKLRHAHGIWHIFVLLGSISHFISILGYVR
jgi:hemolysin III